VEEAKDWRQRYETSQRQPLGRSAALAADGLRLLKTVLEQAKSAEAKKLREEAAAIKEFASVTGKVTWTDGQAVRPVFLVRVEAGKVRVVGE
jgi:ABC-type branched-subunit amino acid transport system substrate-binding protein